jgi:hypothetical protein
LSDEYELRLYDQTLMRFELAKEGRYGRCVANVKQVTDSLELFPINLELDGKSVMKWLEHRFIPKHRAYVRSILITVELTLGNTKGIIDVSKGLSLNDSYWVVPEGFVGKFADYSLYENPFSKALALKAVFGVSESDRGKRIRCSPEFTTGGMLPKAWRRQKGEILLFKRGVWRQFSHEPDPLEPYSEFYASQVAEAMGLEHVKYNLSRWKGALGSTCPLFSDIDTAYVPMASIISDKISGKRLGEIYRICGDWFKEFDSENGTHTHDFFASMMVFDGLILNEDRHLGNFGVLRDNRSGRIIGNAPIFDNGNSLFNFSETSKVRKLVANRGVFCNYFEQLFEEAVQEFGGALQVEQLSCLAGFKFKPHRNYNWDEKQLRIIENYIGTRSKELIGIIRSKPM